MSCAETAEPIDLPFALWTGVGRRNHKFHRIRQVVSMCPRVNVTCASWWTRLNCPSAAAMRPYVKLL